MARLQRCQAHVARNVLAKAPKKLQQAVVDDLRGIFHAPSCSSLAGFDQLSLCFFDLDHCVDQRFCHGFLKSLPGPFAF